MGGDEIFASLKEHLGVGNDETTEDGKITLEHVECNAACDYAPVVMVNWEFFDNQTPDSAKDVVDDLRAGDEVRLHPRPRSARSSRSSRVLAGFPDGLAGEGPSAGPASLAGPAAGRRAAARTTSTSRAAAAEPAGRCLMAYPTGRLTPVLSKSWAEPDSFTLDGYRRHGGYDALPQGAGQCSPTRSSSSSRTPACAAAAARASPPA